MTSCDGLTDSHQLHVYTTTLKPVEINNTDHLASGQYSAGRLWILTFMWMSVDTNLPPWHRHMALPVLFPQQDLDGVEVGPLAGLFAPAALHQDSELLAVTVEAEGGTEGGDTTLTHCLNDLWGGETQ